MPIPFRDYLVRLPEDRRQAIEARAAELIEECRRREVLEEYNATYAAIRSDPDAWAEELAERAVWEGTLLDGLEDD